MTNERDDHIRRRAHEIWEREGRPHGRHEEHWAQAAREIEGESSGGRTTGGTKAAAKPRASRSAEGSNGDVGTGTREPAGEGAGAAMPRRRAAKPAAEGAASPPRAAPKSAKPSTTES
jgi:hypothetical protein